eukprot:TRINITY_DN21944_c0_g1_i1.p1 TRINITY_DN21944_c0_g1~~TRINITY_DN21944_c0_g1_i1.p1  ORF type:complete len:645 (+),score=158.40 TRINITY_DN21944_c0_g1_i1:138-2072(+)
MQAFTNLLSSGDLATFGESFRESLRDLPQKLLQKGGVGIDGSSYRQGKVTGDHQYCFSLHFEPRSEGGGLCQTGVLVATARSQPEGGRSVPIRCSWKRRIGAQLVEIPGITESVYHMSADDIGADIVCVAEPTTAEFRGRACGVLGPFALDPITQMSLENLIASGASRFPVRHYRDQNDPHPRDLQIQVTQNCVKVVHPGAGGGGDHEDVARYTADYPKVLIHPTDQLKFIMELSEDRERAYHFVALSRTSRDLIALLVRCFHARKYIVTSYMLSGLFQNPATPGAAPSATRDCDFDVRRLCRKLGKELDGSVGQLDAVERVLRTAKEEKSQLQAQLKETIGSYTEAIEKLHQQLARQRGGPIAQLQLRLHDAKAMHQKLQLESQEVAERTDEEQRRAPKAVDESEAQGLREEIARLRASINSLSGESAMHSQRDQTRAEELRRLRHDVDVLVGEKEGLEKCMAASERDKQDLVENFLYVKGCLDKLQMASLEAPAASPEIQREVTRLKSSYGQAADDRNRLAQRVEALDRDREKQKTLREAAVEKVMNSNARILEERDRLERERARMSELYQRTMGAMGASGRPAGSGGYPSGAAAAGAAPAAASPGELEALRSEAARKAELLAKREQEGESLRSRLRKLAMA